MEDALKTSTIKIRVDPDEKTELRWAARQAGHAGVSSLLRTLGLEEVKRLRSLVNKDAGGRKTRKKAG